MPEPTPQVSERTITLPSEWPPPYRVPLQPSPQKRKYGTYMRITFYIPSKLCEKLNLDGSEIIGVWPGKRGGRDDTFLAVKLTEEEIAKLPKNDKRKRHNCDHASNPKGALFCIACGARLGGKDEAEDQA